MGRLREIPRTAAFAWSTGVSQTLLATGTRAGAVNADFSDETKLEIWDLETKSSEGNEAKPLASLTTDSRFFDLAWSQPNKDHAEGIIAGALENGSLDLWDAAKVRTNASDAHITRVSKHSGPIKCLQFNPHRPELLATAGAKGELYITNLENPDNPFRVGTSAARADDFDCLDWNKKVPHILVTGSTGGFVTVWDIKAKKESLTLNNYGRKPVSAVAWNPDEPTRLATATPSEQDPLILLWNLRNSSAPERILKGHEQGILSLSWCPQDSELLLSCGKDNRNLCWNPHTGVCYGEYPIVLNWTFQTRFSPRHPGVLATASFDGKITIHSIQNTNGKASDVAGAASQAADGADFFAQAQTQPQPSSFSFPKPPKWMRRPTGVSFGFGGKIVKFQPLDQQSQTSKIRIGTFTPDETVAKSISEFQNALKGPDISEMCESKISSAGSDQGKEDWRVIKTLVSESPRKQILNYLGFNDAVTPKRETNGEDKSVDTQDPDEAKSNKLSEQAKSNRLSAFFETSGESNFLTDLASSKGARTNNPFQIYKGGESDADKDITRNLMLGKFQAALDICLEQKRMSEAFMIAICGGQKCIDKAQAAYFAQSANGPNYLRLLASVVGNNLWDIVYNADLASWKEVMATFCTYADENDFSDLCEALGDRLEESEASKKDASFCYLAGSKLEKVVPIWLGEMRDAEKVQLGDATDESAFSIHVQSLQSFIEKVSIFRRATDYEDKAGKINESEWKLGVLYDKYAEYADVAAAHGQLHLAEEYLSFLPEQYPSAEIARNRVRQATKKAGAAVKVPQRGQPLPQAGFAPNTQTAAVSAARQPMNASYAPTNTFTAVPPLPGYGPVGPTAPAGTGSAYAPPALGGAYQPAGQPTTAPPPMNATGPPPPGPPPSRNINGTNWNDLPDGFSRQTPPRRGTPNSGAPVTAPFPNQSPASANPYGPPPTGPPQYTKPKQTPLPPPPKAGQAPPPLGSPPDRLSQAASPPPRPTSSAASAYAPANNPYAPQQPQNLQPGPPPSLTSNYAPPRAASPYQPPPSAASGSGASNRYAPAPAAHPVTSQGPLMGPPGPGSRPPIAPSPYAPQGQTQPSNTGPPPAGPPPASRGPPPGAGPRPPSTSSQGTASPAPKHPPGDRSHIPLETQPVYEMLNTEMQRIKGRAPANFKPQVDDTEKRINLLFDLLNNETVSPVVVAKLRELSEQMTARNFEQAQAIQTELMTQMEQSGPWMVGVRRLISMSRATPPS